MMTCEYPWCRKEAVRPVEWEGFCKYMCFKHGWWRPTWKTFKPWGFWEWLRGGIKKDRRDK